MTRRELFTRWRFNTAEPEPEPMHPVKADPQMLPDFLRPPGALGEAEFVSTCERSGMCVTACPYDAILPLGPAYGEADGTPAILPRGGPCHLCDDLPCITACPSGALKPVPIPEIRMGTAVLDPSLCWAVKGQPCDYCVKECPLGETAIRWAGDRPEILPEGCVGCGMCVHICTATPEALRIVNPPLTRISIEDVKTGSG